MNVGSVDRLLRLIVGLILLAAPFVPGIAEKLPGGVWNWIIMAVGLLMVLTGVFRFCPAYTLFGVNTCNRT